LRVGLPSEWIQIEGPAALLRFLVEHVDGRTSDNELARRARRTRLPGAAVVEDALTQLRDAGALVPINLALVHQHGLSCNPMPMVEPPTDEAIGRLVARRRTFGPPEHERRALAPVAPSVAAAERRTCRSFLSEPIAFEDLSALLIEGYSGVVKPVASAGALYPCTVTVIANSVAGLPPGSIWRFDHLAHELVRTASQPSRRAIEAALDSTWMAEAPAIVVVAAELEVHAQKYGPRGYRYTLLEVGHVLQAMTAAAVAGGLATSEYGGYDDAVLGERLDLDSAAVLGVLGVGFGRRDRTSGSTAPPELPVPDGVTLEQVHWSAAQDPGFRQVVARYGPRPTDYSSGTASTSEVARTKALVEAVERTAARVGRVDLLAAADEISELWVDVRRAYPHTGDQRGRLELARFRPSTPTEWVRSRTAGGDNAWSPADVVWYPFDCIGLDRRPLYEASSSGVAAHRRVEEAEERAVAELVERDAIARAWYGGRASGALPVDLLPEDARFARERLVARGYEVTVLDLSDHGAFTCLVLATSPAARPSVCSGASATFRDPEAAVVKAFDEALLCALHGSRRRRRLRPEAVRSPADHGHLYHHPDHLERLDPLLACPSVGTLDRSLRFDPCALEVVYVDLPAQDGVAVVRAIADRLVPIGFGFGSDHTRHSALPAPGPNVDGDLVFPHFLS
jgi:SagB-type dehydrogenase family enzyme/YcaO-like protein with predicted kinase domain